MKSIYEVRKELEKETTPDGVMRCWYNNSFFIDRFSKTGRWELFRLRERLRKKLSKIKRSKSA